MGSISVGGVPGNGIQLLVLRAAHRMKIIYRRNWEQQIAGDTEPAILQIEQDWVPSMGASVFFPDNTCGTVTDIEMHYPGDKAPPYVRVWVK